MVEGQRAAEFRFRTSHHFHGDVRRAQQRGRHGSIHERVVAEARAVGGGGRGGVSRGGVSRRVRIPQGGLLVRPGQSEALLQSAEVAKERQRRSSQSELRAAGVNPRVFGDGKLPTGT